jgi:hypothetical protein
MTAETSGLDDAAIRAAVDDKPQTDSVIIHDFFGGAWRPTIVAQYKIAAGSFDDRDAAIKDLRTKLSSIRRADGTLTHHAAGGDEALTVRYEVALASSGGPQLKQVVFGLVSADSDWT